MATSSLKQGDRVLHPVHGPGTIIGEWGCFRDVDPIDGHALEVFGKGIFEVRFSQDDEVRSVNATNLALVESAPEVHPFAQQFRALTQSEYELLRENIRVHGQLMPIVLDQQNRILDGRHRYRICVELSLVPKTISFDAIKDAATDWSLSPEQLIYSANAARRHLTATQRATLALAFLPFARKEAQSRMRKAQARGRETQKLNRSNGEAGANGQAPKWVRGKTTNQVLAEKAGVGLPTMKAIVAVNDHAPELLSKIANGHLSATEAIKMVATKRKQAANKTKPINPAPFSKKNVLRQWQALWSTFVLRFPPRERKNVRQIVMEHLSGLPMSDAKR